MRLQPQSALASSFGSINAITEFQSQSTTLTEQADTGCVLLTFSCGDDDMVQSASRAANVELPVAAGEIKTSDRRAALWLSPRSWLIQCGVDEELALVASLNAAFPQKLAHAVPYTDALCWFALSGDGALDLLVEGSFISLERGGLLVGHAKRTLIAQISAVVVRKGETSWLIAVERSRGHYFVKWLSASARSR